MFIFHCDCKRTQYRLLKSYRTKTEWTIKRTFKYWISSHWKAERVSWCLWFTWGRQKHGNLKTSWSCCINYYSWFLNIKILYCIYIHIWNSICVIYSLGTNIWTASPGDNCLKKSDMPPSSASVVLSGSTTLFPLTLVLAGRNRDVLGSWGISDIFTQTSLSNHDFPKRHLGIAYSSMQLIAFSSSSQ